MVMGSIPLLSKATRRNIASVRFSTLFCALLLMILFAHCGEGAGGCSVDGCSSTHQRSIRRLEKAQEKDPLTDLTPKRCRVLKKLHRCLHKIRRVCRGNLLYHSIKHINDMNQRNFNCSRKPTIASPSNLPPLTKPVEKNTSTVPMTTTPSPSPREGGICSYAGTSPYKHCGMFGDPHLRTFSDVFNTCKVEGTWPLIDNDYMVVMVTNVPVKDGSSATVTTQITVLIKAAGPCAGQRHYVATSGQLPGAFTDGSSMVGSVEVVEADPGKRVEIRAGFIGTTVIIRQVARYLTFAIQIPEEFVTGVASRTQLCVQGCPADHKLSPIQNLQSKESNQDHIPIIESPVIDPPVAPHPGESDFPEKVQYFTEKEAREKCRQILLDLPGEDETKDDLIEEGEPTEDTPESAKKSFDSLSSLSSAAFSSLVSSPGDESPGKKHHKMAAARRPPSELLHPSSKRPRGSKSRRTRPRNRSRRSSQSQTSNEDEECSMEKDESSNSNFYFESCVFDLITTGDIDFTLAAKVALDDVKRTHVMGGDAPGTSLEVIRLWEPLEPKVKCPDPDRKGSGGKKDGRGKAPSVLASNLTLLICVIFSCVCINVASLSSVLFTVKSVKRKEINNFNGRNHQQKIIQRTNLILSEAS